MSTPKHSPSELIAAAQEAGWHHNELGRNILAELSRRQAMGDKPKQVVWGLAITLLASLAFLGYVYAQNTQLSERVASGLKAGTIAEQGAKELVAQKEKQTADLLAAKDKEVLAERARADDAVMHEKAIKAAGDATLASTIEKFTSQLTTLKQENDTLRVENAGLKAAAKTARP